jgi:arginyl-tRNA synthetase
MILPDEHLRKLLRKAITKAYPEITDIEVPIEPTTDVQFGDYTSTVALKLAKLVSQSPRDVAVNLIALLGAQTSMLLKAEVAGPGFINFTLKPAWIMKQVKGVLADRQFGSNTSGKGKRILVEYISANPTGPMTLGNGRGAFGGDTLAIVSWLATARATASRARSLDRFMALFYPCPLSRCKVARNARIATLSSGGA